MLGPYAKLAVVTVVSVNGLGIGQWVPQYPEITVARAVQQQRPPAEPEPQPRQRKREPQDSARPVA